VPTSAAAAALLISHMSIDGEVTSSSQCVKASGESDGGKAGWVDVLAASGKASTIVVGEDGHVPTQQAAAAISPGASSSCSLHISVTDIKSIHLTCTRELDHTSGCGAGLSSSAVMAKEETTSSHYMAVVEVRGWKSKCAEQFYNAVVLANVRAGTGCVLSDVLRMTAPASCVCVLYNLTMQVEPAVKPAGVQLLTTQAAHTNGNISGLQAATSKQATKVCGCGCGYVRLRCAHTLIAAAC
jgi:hypothetical protein